MISLRLPYQKDGRRTNVAIKKKRVQRRSNHNANHEAGKDQSQWPGVCGLRRIKDGSPQENENVHD